MSDDTQREMTAKEKFLADFVTKNWRGDYGAETERNIKKRRVLLRKAYRAWVEQFPDSPPADWLVNAFEDTKQAIREAEHAWEAINSHAIDTFGGEF